VAIGDSADWLPGYEAEQLADRIAILHEGRILVNGTLGELKKLLPPANVEYISRRIGVLRTEWNWNRMQKWHVESSTGTSPLPLDQGRGRRSF
jgi:ABC-type multidrug transport system ATPase subunit